MKKLISDDKIEVLEVSNNDGFSNSDEIYHNFKIIDPRDKTYSSLKSILSDYSRINLKTSIPNVIYSRLGLGLEARADVTGENIAEFVLPLVEFIRKLQPDCIVACDRGARPIAQAVSALYHSLYGNLPSADGIINMRRISKANPVEQTKEHLRLLVDKLMQDRDHATILVLDDWINSGFTQRIVNKMFSELSEGKIDVKFGVLVGSGADVSGKLGDYSVVWHDEPELTGIEYDGFVPRIIHSEARRKFLEQMSRNIREVSKAIKQRRSQEIQDET